MSWSLRWKMIVVQFIKCWNTGSDIFNVVIDFRRSKFLLFPIPCRHWGIYFGHKDFCSPHIQHLELANESSVKGSSNRNLDIVDWHIIFRLSSFGYLLKIPTQDSHTKEVFMCWSYCCVFRPISNYLCCPPYQI